VKKYLVGAVLVGGLSIAGLLAQKSDQPKTPTTDQSKTSTEQSQAGTTAQPKTAAAGKSQTLPPVPPKPKKGAKKTNSKSAAVQWAPCTLPPQTQPFTFWQTCTNVTLNSCTINASCKMATGQSRAATFDTNLVPQCPSAALAGKNLYNNNGTMCCGWAGMPGPYCGN
jgi:hypothetical protein